MATLGTKKYIQKRWHILIMRPQSRTHTLTISPLFILVMIAFGIIFTTGGVLVINMYLELYPSHLELQAKYDASLQNINRMKNMYEYQTQVNGEYLKLLSTNSKPPVAATETSPPDLDSKNLDSKKTNTSLAPQKIKKTLQNWSDLFPNPQRATLDAGELEVTGGNFNFKLTNISPRNRPAMGHLLLLFKVDTGGENTLVPFPEFDFKESQPDFTTGPGYNINYSKDVQGLLKIPENSQVVEMMVVGKAQNGQIVLKKKLQPSK